MEVVQKEILEELIQRCIQRDLRSLEQEEEQMKLFYIVCRLRVND
jgi:hypothetical protein